MHIEIAPLHGSVVTYVYAPTFVKEHEVMVMKSNYKNKVMSEKTFEYLYYQLTDSRAALKEDCIRYAIYEPGKPITEYPDWFKEVYYEGFIMDEFGWVFIDDVDGEIAMSPGGVLLQNYIGQLRYMERYDFDKYYDIIGE